LDLDLPKTDKNYIVDAFSIAEEDLSFLDYFQAAEIIEFFKDIALPRAVFNFSNRFLLLLIFSLQ